MERNSMKVLDQYLGFFDVSKDEWAGSLPLLPNKDKIAELIDHLKKSEAFELRKDLSDFEINDKTINVETNFLNCYKIKPKLLESVYSFLVKSILRDKIFIEKQNILLNTQNNLKYLSDSTSRTSRIKKKLNKLFDKLEDQHDMNYAVFYILDQQSEFYKINLHSFALLRIFIDSDIIPRKFDEWHWVIIDFLKNPYLLNQRKLSFEKKMIDLETNIFAIEYYSELLSKMEDLTKSNFFNTASDFNFANNLSDADKNFYEKLSLFLPLKKDKAHLRNILIQDNKRDTAFFNNLLKFYQNEGGGIRIGRPSLNNMVQSSYKNLKNLKNFEMNSNPLSVKASDTFKLYYDHTNKESH